MKLHKSESDFADLIALTADHIGIPEDAIKRDYYIVLMLQRLEASNYAQNCVFKGGTSLSKCYPDSISRFSEDIDLTFMPSDISVNQIGKALKAIEKIMIADDSSATIPEERSARSKSSIVWFEGDPTTKVKLEIGSSVRPDPFGPRTLKTYIQDYMEAENLFQDVASFNLSDVTLNVLGIERTFLDKVFAVKRHALCGTLATKVRHIYDVKQLFGMQEIQTFLSDRDQLTTLILETKKTDYTYLEKRSIAQHYNPVEPFAFSTWSNCFDEQIKTAYESLHEDLLYTSEQQDIQIAIETFNSINNIFEEIGE